MAKTLFIIGNGFDCYGHGLSTKYLDFRKYLTCRYPNYNLEFDGILESHIMPDGDVYYDQNDLVGSIISLIDSCTGKGWGDLEAASGAAYVESILERNEWYFNDVNWDDDEREIRNAVYDNEDLSNSVAGGFGQLRNFFEDWAFNELANIDFSYKRKLKKPSFKHSVFLNFNYTSTLEDLYHVPSQNVCHIHGYAKDIKSKIMFGHGEDENIEIPDTYYGAQNAFDSLLRYLHKDTDDAIRKNISFLNKLKGITKIYSYGFSFSDVDMCYIDEITKRLNPNKVRWYFNSFDWQNNKENIEKVRSRGYKIRQCSRW